MIAKVYASIVLPGVFGLAVKMALRAVRVPAVVNYFVCLAAVVILCLVGDRVQSYFFREIREKRESLRRSIYFFFLLPGIYGSGLLIFSLPLWLPIVPPPVAILLSLLVWSVGLYFFLQDDIRRG